jgi:hypothetical protein
MVPSLTFTLFLVRFAPHCSPLHTASCAMFIRRNRGGGGGDDAKGKQFASAADRADTTPAAPKLIDSLGLMTAAIADPLPEMPRELRNLIAEFVRMSAHSAPLHSSGTLCAFSDAPALSSLCARTQCRRTCRRVCS